MKCTNCGSELPNGAMFCGNCGNSVADNTSRTTHSTPHSGRVCRSCGSPLEADAEFCAECGTRVSESSFAGVSRSKSSNKKRGNIIILSVLGGTALILVIVLAILLTGGKSENPDPSNTPEPVVSEVPAEEASSEPSFAPAPPPGEPMHNEPPMQNGSYRTYYVVNCNESISLRVSPDTSSRIIKNIPLGSPVSYVDSAANGFARVIYNGTSGYALQSYLSPDSADIKKPSAPNPPQSAPSKSAGVVSNPTYKTYKDYDFGFSCSYPSHFQMYVENNDFVRYSLRAPDGTATLKICAGNNTAGISPSDYKADFVSRYPGSTDYEAGSDTWFAVSTNSGGQAHYAYYHVASDGIKGFELHYDKQYESIYDRYVNSIYDSLNF